ncbi:MAG: DUF3833 family protein [Verrucomicrobiota bacterium]
MKRILLFAAFLLVIATGCSSLQPRDFAGATPTFEPDKYFTGHVRSWGVTENRAGEPKSRFTTESFGKRDASGDVMIEQTFHYEDGRTQKRLWHVHRIDAHHYEATANDVVGKAKGEAYGNAFRWEYTITLKPGNPFSHVRLHQWMYLPEGTETMFTRVAVKKFGLKIAQVSESFERVSPANP